MLQIKNCTINQLGKFTRYTSITYDWSNVSSSRDLVGWSTLHSHFLFLFSIIGYLNGKWKRSANSGFATVVSNKGSNVLTAWDVWTAALQYLSWLRRKRDMWKQSMAFVMFMYNMKYRMLRIQRKHFSQWKKRSEVSFCLDGTRSVIVWISLYSNALVADEI